MVCRKRGCHSIADCEDSEVVAARKLRKLKSDLFSPSGCLPSAQNEIMIRNASVSPFLCLPPEIRLRICSLVLGGQQLWIGQTPSRDGYHHNKSDHDYVLQRDTKHWGAEFYHSNTVDGSGRGLDLRPLRICRQIFTETALLPYALNKFIFERDDVRRAFERFTRPGKKLVQRKAIGKYEIMGWSDFQSWVLDIAEENGE